MVNLSKVTWGKVNLDSDCWRDASSEFEASGSIVVIAILKHGTFRNNLPTHIEPNEAMCLVSFNILSTVDDFCFLLQLFSTSANHAKQNPCPKATKTTTGL